VSNKSEQALRRSKVEIRRDGSIDDRRRKDAYDSDLLFAVMASRQEMMFEDRVFERLLSQAKAASMRPGAGARPEAVVAAAEARDEIFAIVATNIDQHMDLFLEILKSNFQTMSKGFRSRAVTLDQRACVSI
jgi:hypothetical protein